MVDSTKNMALATNPIIRLISPQFTDRNVRATGASFAAYQDE